MENASARAGSLHWAFQQDLLDSVFPTLSVCSGWIQPKAGREAGDRAAELPLPRGLNGSY